MKALVQTLIVGTLIACGPSPTALQCHLKVYGYVSNSRAQRLSERAFELMSLESHIVPPKDFCPAFENIPIQFRTDYEWQATWEAKGTLVNGEYALYRGIQLSPPGDYLVHELFHAWDTWHLVFNPDHKGWHKNGYYDVIDKFNNFVFNDYQLLHDPNVLADEAGGPTDHSIHR